MANDPKSIVSPYGLVLYQDALEEVRRNMRKVRELRESEAWVEDYYCPVCEKPVDTVLHWDCKGNKFWGCPICALKEEHLTKLETVKDGEFLPEHHPDV